MVLIYERLSKDEVKIKKEKAMLSAGMSVFQFQQGFFHVQSAAKGSGISGFWNHPVAGLNDQ